MFYIGLDLGQRHDPTAIAVVERLDLRRAYDSPVLHSLNVRYVYRVPLGTPYPAIVERIRRMIYSDDLSRNCALAVDATGVGAPVVDMLRAAQLGCEICAVNITGGDRQHQSGSVWNVPKQDLLASLQVVLERGELRLSRQLKNLGSLIRELNDFSAVIQSGGRIRLGADAFGQHDDQVIALALACWRAQRPHNKFGTERLF